MADSQSPPPDEQRLMTLDEVADYLQLSPKTVYRMVQAKKVPCFRLGRQWRFRRDQLDQWLMQQAYQEPTSDEDSA